MPILLDLPGMFLAGSAIALASRKRIEAERVSGESRYVRSALIFGVFYALSVAFLCFWREDWMWSYLLRPPLPTMIWYLMFAGLLSTTAWLGAILTQRAIRRRRRGLAVAFLLASLAVLTGLWLGTYEAYTHVGTFDEYHRGDAFPLRLMPDTTRVMLIGLVVNATVLAVIGLVNRWLDWRWARESDYLSEPPV